MLAEKLVLHGARVCSCVCMHPLQEPRLALKNGEKKPISALFHGMVPLLVHLYYILLHGMEERFQVWKNGSNPCISRSKGDFYD